MKHKLFTAIAGSLLIFSGGVFAYDEVITVTAGSLKNCDFSKSIVTIPANMPYKTDITYVCAAAQKNKQSKNKYPKNKPTYQNNKSKYQQAEPDFNL